jgi:multidrug efflux pump subunit AcrA (membrane-fusion protein)
VIGHTEIAISDRPVDTADEDVLLKRTRLGIPVPAQPDAGQDRRPETPTAPPIPRWAAALALVAVVAAIAAVAAWKLIDRPSAAPASPASERAAGEEMVVEVRAVVRRELSFTVSATGSVKPHRQVTVSAEIPGRVTSTPAAQGSTVVSGQELIRLDDREIRLQISEASSSITSLGAGRARP